MADDEFKSPDDEYDQFADEEEGELEDEGATEVNLYTGPETQG